MKSIIRRAANVKLHTSGKHCSGGPDLNFLLKEEDQKMFNYSRNFESDSVKTTFESLLRLTVKLILNKFLTSGFSLRRMKSYDTSKIMCIVALSLC